MFNSIFGAGASQAILGIDSSQSQSGLYNNPNISQIQAQYARAQQARFVSHNWVFNGKPCTLQEFANAIWGEAEHEDKMLFLLTHSGPKQK